MSLLFTPGPLNTSLSVKRAMLHDYGSRDVKFVDIVTSVRKRLVAIAGKSVDEFTMVPLQGSGTTTVEAVFCNVIGKRHDAKVLILSNGAYGKRMAETCAQAGFEHDIIHFDETEPITVNKKVEEAMSKMKYALICMVQCETSTGMLNPVDTLVTYAKRKQPESMILLDSMSCFGAVAAADYDFLVSSANKCLQGVPGFGFVIARKSALIKCKGNCSSLSMDLVAQYQGLEANGQFRFTPPTHSFLAFHQALNEFDDEGGLKGRYQRYLKNSQIVVEGMCKLGFKTLLKPEYLSPIITSFLYPDDPHFSFEQFYTRLSTLGCIIYPGKVSTSSAFRIGHIGDLHEKDCRKLIATVGIVLNDMGVNIQNPILNGKH